MTLLLALLFQHCRHFFQACHRKPPVPSHKFITRLVFHRHQHSTLISFHQRSRHNALLPLTSSTTDTEISSLPRHLAAHFPTTPHRLFAIPHYTPPPSSPRLQYSVPKSLTHLTFPSSTSPQHPTLVPTVFPPALHHDISRLHLSKMSVTGNSFLKHRKNPPNDPNALRNEEGFALSRHLATYFHFPFSAISTTALLL